MIGQYQSIGTDMPPNAVLGRDRKNRTCPFKGNCTFIFWNAGGFTLEKQAEFDHLIHKREVDAFAVCEAGSISDNDKLGNLDVQGYIIYNLPRERQVAAGMIIGVKTGLTARFEKLHTMEEDDKIELVQLEIWKGHAKTKYIIAYNPPNNITDKLDTLEIDRSTILIGDFNAHNISWGYRDTCRFGESLEEYIDSQPLILLDGTPNPNTFLSNTGSLTRPDLAFCHASLYGKINQENLESPSGADHKMLLLTRMEVEGKKEEVKVSWNFKKAKWNEYQKETEEKFLARVKTTKECREYEEVCNIILEAAKKHIPRGKVKKYKPFWNEELKKLREDRNKACREAEILQTPEAMEALKKATLDFKKKLRESKRETLHQYVSNIDYKKDATKAHTFFSKLCNKGKKKVENKPIIYKNKTLIGDRAKAEALCKNIAQQSNNRKLGHIKVDKSKYKRDPMDPYNGLFVIMELNEAIKKLKNKKAPGPDGIHPEFLKHLGKYGRDTLLHLCNSTWRRNIPDGWRKADVIPILKKGKDASKIDSYRPISLTSMIAKVMEHMVNLRLRSYLETQNRLTPHQAGFRSHRGTEDQIAYITQEVKEGFNKKHSTLAVYVDFKTAFDIVDRKRLLQKMEAMEIPENLYRWVKIFLSQRFIRVKYNGKASIYRQTRSGVPQGAVLSPTLFLIYINDLAAYIQEKSDVRVKKYADDVILWCSGGDDEYLEREMNKALKALYEWAERDGMTVNETKTVYDYYTMSHTKPDFNLKYGDSFIRQEENAVYLGMTLDSKMTGSTQVDKMSKAAKKRLTFMKRVAGVDWGASTEVLATTYKTYVRPVLEYGNSVLLTAPKNHLAKLDRVQNQALRIATGAAKSTPVVAMEMQTNTPPLTARRNKAAICLHEKLLRLEEEEWDREPVERLKTQTTFITAVQQAKKQTMNKVDLKDRMELPKPDMRVAILDIQHELTVEGIERKKIDYTEDELKHLTAAHIAKHYPTPEWTHMYTDGSATPGEGNAGAGVYSDIFQQAWPAGRNGSNYDGEIKAICEALIKIKELQISKTVILSDSKAAIQAIVSKEERDQETLECKRLLVWLHNRNKHVILQWVPAHCNIHGNDEADKLAKEGSKMKQYKKALSYNAVKSHVCTAIKSNVKKTWEKASKGKQWLDAVTKKVKWSNRQTETAQFRLETGHDLLGKHLHKLGITDSNKCTLCATEQHTRGHLLRCPELQDIKDALPKNMAEPEKESYLYWETRKRMMAK